MAMVTCPKANLCINDIEGCVRNINCHFTIANIISHHQATLFMRCGVEPTVGRSALHVESTQQCLCSSWCSRAEIVAEHRASRRHLEMDADIPFTRQEWYECCRVATLWKKHSFFTPAIGHHSTLKVGKNRWPSLVPRTSQKTSIIKGQWPYRPAAMVVINDNCTVQWYLNLIIFFDWNWAT